jgi:hypothetical protein
MTPKFTPTGLVVLRTTTPSFKDNVCVDAETEKRKARTAAKSQVAETEIFFIARIPQI